MDDKQLVDRIRSGDRSAQRTLYDAHVDRVFRLAYRMTGDDSLARDFTQDAFVRAFDRLDGYRGDGVFDLDALGNDIGGPERTATSEAHPESGSSDRSVA